MLPKQDVEGSNPFTRSRIERSSVQCEELAIRDLVLLVADEKVERHLLLRTKSNDELFSLYEAELALTIRNERNLVWYRCVLREFKFFLEKFPPSADVGKKLLTRRAKSKPAILRKNYSIVRNFLKWYGDELTLKITCLRCSI